MSYSLSEEKKRAHKLSLDSRSALEICGVEEVLGFDEERVSLRSSEGGLEIEGSGIKIETLDTDSGIVKLSGSLPSFSMLSISALMPSCSVSRPVNPRPRLASRRPNE